MRMTIGQVAKESGLASSAIRFYEQTGVLPKPIRIGGRRQYDGSILEKLAVLDRAKACGFSLAEIRQLFYGFREGAPPSERWQKLARRKLIEFGRYGPQNRRDQRTPTASLRMQ